MPGLVITLIAYVAMCGFAILAPAYLLARLGFARTSLGVALVTAAALTIDHLYNWEGLSYPHFLLGGVTDFFPLTILFALGAIAIGFSACLERL